MSEPYGCLLPVQGRKGDIMKYLFLLLLFLCFSAFGAASFSSFGTASFPGMSFSPCASHPLSEPCLTPYVTHYVPEDSIRIEKMLRESQHTAPEENVMLFFARQFLGTPYVGNTLDCHDSEGLVVNLSQLDCTTFVETVLALALCSRRGETSFTAFCHALREIRYVGGEVAYTSRKHYFTLWMEEGERQGLVRHVCPDSVASRPSDPLFSGVQHVRLSYMSSHATSYSMLAKHPEWLPAIRAMEKRYDGRAFPFIPKRSLCRSGLLKKYLADGDIIAILTDRPGLDTSHVGIAVWRNGQLFLLHASSRWKKVVVEPSPLYEYMMKQPRQTGVRAVRPFL